MGLADSFWTWTSPRADCSGFRDDLLLSGDNLVTPPASLSPL